MFPLNPCLCLTGSSYKVTEVQGDSDLCDRFEMCGGVKQGCVLAVTIFSIEFPLLLNHAFSLLCSWADMLPHKSQMQNQVPTDGWTSFTLTKSHFVQIEAMNDKCLLMPFY